MKRIYSILIGIMSLFLLTAFMGYSQRNMDAKNETEQPTDTKDKLVIPVFKDEEERTKNYTFSLQPSARKRLDGLAKEHNFKSASKFLNELIKNM